MKMTLSKTFWKYSLLAMNTLISMEVMVFFTCGVVALGGAGSEAGAYVVTGIGSLIMTICFWGCFASLRESYILSLTYLGITILGLLSQTVFMIYFSVQKSEYMDMAVERINDLWEKELNEPGTMDIVQSLYSCCGRDSPQDYLEDRQTSLPKSCCSFNDCSVDDNIFPKGCAPALTSFIDDQSDYFIVSIVVLTALELLGLLSAYYFCKLIKDKEEKPDKIFISE